MVKDEYLNQVISERGKDSEKQFKLKDRVLKTFNNLLKHYYNKGLEKNMSLLDLGGADNSFMNVAKKYGLDSTGIDIDEINFENDYLPFEEKKFDIVTANSVLEHLYNPGKLLKSVYKILKDEGFLIIITPNWKYSYKDFYNDPTHVHPYTPESLEFLLKSFKFKNIKNVPWLVCKPSWLWDIPFNFAASSKIPFRSDSHKLIPNFLKGQTKVILSVCQK